VPRLSGSKKRVNLTMNPLIQNCMKRNCAKAKLPYSCPTRVRYPFASDGLLQDRLKLDEGEGGAGQHSKAW